jgi:hypothetical protein
LRDKWKVAVAIGAPTFHSLSQADQRFGPASFVAPFAGARSRINVTHCGLGSRHALTLAFALLAALALAAPAGAATTRTPTPGAEISAYYDSGRWSDDIAAVVKRASTRVRRDLVTSCPTRSTSSRSSGRRLEPVVQVGHLLGVEVHADLRERAPARP